MADFKIAYKRTSIAEGFYSNDPNDPGGETWKGIARNKDKGWEGWEIVDHYKKSNPGTFRDLLKNDNRLEQLVQKYYKINYWDVNSLDLIGYQLIANELYDTGVNMGVHTAAKFVQQVLNVSNRNGKDYADVTVDGKVGPKTAQVINSHPRPAELLKGVNCLQGARYINLTLASSKFEVFYNGWMTRVMEDWKVEV